MTKRCVICGKEFTAVRKRICCSWECQKIRHYQTTKNSLSYQRAKQKAAEERKRLKAAGICVRCKRNKASDGHITCEECTEKNRIAGRDYYRKKVMSEYL